MNNSQYNFNRVDLSNFKSRKPAPLPSGPNQSDLNNTPSFPSTPPGLGQPPIYTRGPSFGSPQTQTQKPGSSKPQTPKEISNLPDFSHTDVVHTNFYNPKYAYRLTRELKDKGFSSATTRNVLAGMLKQKSNRGLNRKEVRLGLDKLVETGKITHAQSKFFKKITKIY